MRSRYLKLLVLGTFSVFAAWGLCIPGTSTIVRADDSAARKDEIVEKIAGYKNWTQVNKAEKKETVDAEAVNVLSVSDSTVYG